LFSVALSRRFYAVKVIPISEAAPQLNQLLIDALKGETIVLTNGTEQVELTPRAGVSEGDFELVELEAEMVKALDQSFTPYVPGEFRAMLQEIIRERKKD
jgi:hypothetical protein